MLKPFAILGAVIALVLAISFGTTQAPVSTAPPREVQSEAAIAAWNFPVWTGGISNARQHWEKHRSEFPEYKSMQDYVDGVHAFLKQPPEGTQVKLRDNGDTIYFHEPSGVFAVQASNGAPRTFFRPDDGIAYWKRQ